MLRYTKVFNAPKDGLTEVEASYQFFPDVTKNHTVVRYLADIFINQDKFEILVKAVGTISGIQLKPEMENESPNYAEGKSAEEKNTEEKSIEGKSTEQ